MGWDGFVCLFAGLGRLMDRLDLDRVAFACIVDLFELNEMVALCVWAGGLG